MGDVPFLDCSRAHGRGVDTHRSPTLPLSAAYQYQYQYQHQRDFRFSTIAPRLTARVGSHCTRRCYACSALSIARFKGKSSCPSPLRLLFISLVSGRLVFGRKDSLATGEMRGHGPCLYVKVISDWENEGQRSRDGMDDSVQTSFWKVGLQG